MKPPHGVKRIPLFQKRLLNLYEQLSHNEITEHAGDELFRALLKFITAELSCRAGSLFILDKEDGSLIFKAIVGGDENLKGKRIEKGKGIVGMVAATQKCYVTGDVKKNAAWYGEISKRNNFKTEDMIACPIKHGESVIGVIEVLNKSRGTFGKKDRNKLISLAPHLAIFMKHIIDGLEQKRIIEFEDRLYKLSALLNSSLDTKTIARDAMKAIVALVNAEVGSLLLLDKEKQELYFEVALGGGEKALKEIRLKLGQGIAGWVAQNRQPVIVNDPSNDDRWLFKKSDDRSGIVTRNILCVPVMSGNQVIGVMQALNKKDGRFTLQDQELLTSLSDHVAIAIENARLHEELRRTFVEVVESLSEAIEKRDPYTGGHTKRVVEYSLILADEMGLASAEKENLKMAALLHDVGKIGVDDSVLRKPARLDDAEFNKMKEHPSIGADILGKVPEIKKIIPGILYHHEWYNGKGYPAGLSKDQVPIIARIISIADTYDAITSDRPYRKGLTHEYAVAELRRYKGTQFDPELVEYFIHAFERRGNRI